MIRVVLAVLLATAILGSGHQAAERGGRAEAVTLVREEARTVATAADRLAARNDPGAARTVPVRVPRRRWGRPRASLRLGDDLRWRVGGRAGRVRTAVALRTPDGPLRLGGGRHRLRLTLVAGGGDPVVAVRRFMSEHGTTDARVRTRPRARVSV